MELLGQIEDLHEIVKQTRADLEQLLASFLNGQPFPLEEWERLQKFADFLYESSLVQTEDDTDKRPSDCTVLAPVGSNEQDNAFTKYHEGWCCHCDANTCFNLGPERQYAEGGGCFDMICVRCLRVYRYEWDDVEG